MVDRTGCSYGNADSFLMGHLCYCLHRSFPVGQQTQHVIIGLLTRCQCGSGGRAVSHVTACRIGHYKSRIRELGKT